MRSPAHFLLLSNQFYMKHLLCLKKKDKKILKTNKILCSWLKVTNAETLIKFKGRIAKGGEENHIEQE